MKFLAKIKKKVQKMLIVRTKKEKDKFIEISIKQIQALKPVLFYAYLEAADKIKLKYEKTITGRDKNDKLVPMVWKERGVVASMGQMIDAKIAKMKEEGAEHLGKAFPKVEVDYTAKLLNKLHIPMEFAKLFVIISDDADEKEDEGKFWKKPSAIRLFMPVKIVREIEEQGMKFPTGWKKDRTVVVAKDGNHWTCVMSCAKRIFEEEGFDEWISYFKAMMKGKLNSVVVEYVNEVARAKKNEEKAV